jgi:hypothetical protein
MAYTIILHPSGDEPIVGEVENLPGTNDQIVILNNPRRMDGKELPYIAENVTTVIWPFIRLNFIEILPTKEEEEIISFVRE